MKKGALLLVCMVVFSLIGFSQQWGGSTTTSGNVMRGGRVGIGPDGGGGLTPSSALTVMSVCGQQASIQAWAMKSPGCSGGDPDIFQAQSWTTVFGPINTEFCIKANTGNVGVGTATPSVKLHVVGSGLFSNDVNIQGKLRIGPTAANGTFANYRLSVDGDVVAKRVVVQTTNWADFVFHENYQLATLGEVESFIKKNKHLPDVPKENEVVENGISLGEMNVTLLRKVEELTLYLIEQQKRIERLEEILTSNK